MIMTMRMMMKVIVMSSTGNRKRKQDVYGKNLLILLAGHTEAFDWL